MAGSYTRRINLYINGKEVKNDIHSIRAEMNKLVNEQTRMTRGSREYVEAGKKIRILDGIIQQHREQVRSVSKSWSFENFSQAMNKYFLAVSTFVAGFSGLLYSGKKAITMFAEFDDIVANVKRTTGMATDDIYKMNESLKEVNTRTAQEDLMELGIIAGKLGIAEKDVEGFIKAADKINVALSGALGQNTEEAINQIGKLVSIFKISDKFGIETGMLKVGSAINSLGLASTANEGYLVEFTKRVGGVAPTADISIQSVLGLAATLDQLGQTSEVSSTVYSQVITGMFKKTGEYARIAGMETKKFAALLKRDANEAFIKVMEGLRGNNEGMERLVAMMGDLGLDGKRAITVLGVLSNNTAMLREQQDMANKSFSDGNSILDAFNTRNNSAQAILEKKRKVLNNMAIDLGRKLMPVLTASTSGFTYFVKSVSVIAGFTIKNSAAILGLITTIGAYIVATKLATLWQNRQTQATLAQIVVTKIEAFVMGTARAATLLYAMATALLTGNIGRASAAMRVFNKTFIANGLGLLVAGIALAAGAIYAYIRSLNKLSATQQALNAVRDRTVELMVEETAKINMLQALIDSETASLVTKRNAIDELKRIIPGYNAMLDASGKTVYNNTEAVKKYIEQLRKQYLLQAYQEEFGKASLEFAKAQEKYDTEAAIYEQMPGKEDEGIKVGPGSLTTFQRYNPKNTQGKKMRDAQAEMDEKAEVLKELQKKVEASMNSINDYNSRIKEAAEMIFNYNNAIKAATDQASKEAIHIELNKWTARYIRLKELRSGKGSPGAAPVNNNGLEDEGGDGYIPTTDPSGDKSKWSLNNDLTYLKESLQMKQDYGKGVIKTEQELEAKLRDLAIKVLKERILSGKESGEQLLSIQEQLAEKYIEIRKERNEREKDLQEAADKGKSPVEKENREYEERLILLKLFGKKREDMSALELAALEALEKEHKEKLAKLDADAMKDEIDRRQKAFEYSFAELKLQHTNELNAITTLDQAKQILSKTMSAKELEKVKSLDKAKKLIAKQSAAEEEEFARKHLTELMEIVQKVMSSGEFEGINLSDNILSEEEKKVLLDRIQELMEALAKLKGETSTDNSVPQNLDERGGVDILGFSQDDWNLLFDNLEYGKMSVGEILAAAIMVGKALTEVFKTYYESVSKQEQAKLEEFEESVNYQKETLQQSLDGNRISQEAYHKAVAELDKDLDRRKAELERKNAIRARNSAIMEAIVNTATAVTSALKIKPPLGIILAAIVGGLGAFQIGKIMSTPLPTLPGKEAGGYIDVERSQDGKYFRARNDPWKRGYVSTPTVITGEKPGSAEYVVSDAGVNNPTVRPILDILEMARISGNLATINLPAILESTRTYPGRQQGGYISDITGSSSGKIPAEKPSGQDPAMQELLQQAISVFAALKTRLDQPIKSMVALHGRGGLYETMDEDQELKNNANL